MKEQNSQLKSEFQSIMQSSYGLRNSEVCRDLTEIIKANFIKLETFHQNKIDEMHVVHAEEIKEIEEMWKNKLNEVYKQTFHLTQSSSYKNVFTTNKDRSSSSSQIHQNAIENMAENFEKKRQKLEEIEMRRQYEEKLEKYEIKVAKLTAQLSKLQKCANDPEKLEEEKEENNKRLEGLIEQLKDKDEIVESMKAGYEIVVQELKAIKDKQKDFEQEINQKNAKIFDMYGVISLK